MEINQSQNVNKNEENESNSCQFLNEIEITLCNKSNPEINSETNNTQTERLIINRPKYPIYCNISNIQTEYYSIIQKLICCLCKGILYSPLQDECQHIFCEKCYQIYCPNSPFKCPITEAIIPKPSELNGLKLILNDLKIYCPNECDWNGKYIELKEHKKLCPNEFIKCPFNKCPYEIIRKNLETHKTVCIYREEKCLFCNEIMQFLFLDEHYKVCSKFPIDCILDCGKQIIRCNMNYHIHHECENTELNCKYYQHGCDQICKRKDMEKHLKDEVAFHLNLIERVLNKYIPILNQINYFTLLKKKRKNDYIYITEEENEN